MLGEQDHEQDFNGQKFISLPMNERLEQCRSEARKAIALADHADQEYIEAYLSIARQWLALAEDMERAAG